MSQDEDLASLRARVEELEEQNETLLSTVTDSGVTRSVRPGRARRVCATVLIVLAALIAPVAVLGSWVRVQLIDSDQFVQTFAPLSQQPEVQNYLTDQVVTAVDENLDITGLVGSIFDGVESLDLPPKAASAIGLLEAPATQGIRSAISGSVDGVVKSEQFSTLWAGVLRETHSRSIALIQGDPNAAIQLADDGTLSLQLGPLVSSVKQQMLANGMQFASLIPEVDRSIPLVASDSLATARIAYQVAVAVGSWLPWVVIALAAAGVLVARGRMRALTWVGIAFGASLLLFAGILAIGGMVFVGAVSPSIMPSATAEVIFTQLTALLTNVNTALILVSALVALLGWLLGPSPRARALRAAGGRGFVQMSDRWGTAILGVAIAIGVLSLLAAWPGLLYVSTIVLVFLLAVLVIVQLVPRSVPGRGAPSATETALARHDA